MKNLAERFSVGKEWTYSGLRDHTCQGMLWVLMRRCPELGSKCVVTG